MKAIIITQPGPPEVLQAADIAKPAIQHDEVLIRVKAAGVNRPDVFQRKGNYPPPPGAPDTPGLEVAGWVEQVGSSVERWRVGDKVCALMPGGGYAELAKAHQGHCLPIPEGWSFEEAASLPETVFTVWHNVFRLGGLKSGEHFLVHGGSSGIGITAIQLAKAFGAKVFSTAGTEEKCRFCEGLGASLCVNYNEEDFEQALRAYGADVVLDMIGGDYTVKNLSLLRFGGRLIFVNAMKGGKLELNALDIMRRQLTISGSTLRARDTEFKADLAKEIEHDVWPLISKKLFKPVIFQTFPFTQASDAHTLMESSRHMGKIILTF